MTRLLAIDLETCGLTPEDGGVVEIGWSYVTPDGGGGWRVSPGTSMITNPHHPSDILALATHHISDEEAATGREFDEALAIAVTGIDVLVAHVAKFEQQFVKTDIPWICTWKVAVHHASHAPGHSLQVLRYWLKLAVDPVLAMPPHRAGPDAYVCAHLLARMLAKISIEEMIEISSRPALLPKLRFGKHGELPLAQVPKDYLRWILTQDFDEDTKYTANHYLKL